MFITADLNLVSAGKPARPAVIRRQLRFPPDGVKNSTRRCAISSTQRWVLEAGFSLGLRRIYWSRRFISTFRCSVFPQRSHWITICVTSADGISGSGQAGTAVWRALVHVVHYSRGGGRRKSRGLDKGNPAQTVRNRALSLNIICNILFKTMQKRRQKN